MLVDLSARGSRKSAPSAMTSLPAFRDLAPEVGDGLRQTVVQFVRLLHVRILQQSASGHTLDCRLRGKKLAGDDRHLKLTVPHRRPQARQGQRSVRKKQCGRLGKSEDFNGLPLIGGGTLRDTRRDGRPRLTGVRLSLHGNLSRRTPPPAAPRSRARPGFRFPAWPVLRCPEDPRRGRRWRPTRS